MLLALHYLTKASASNVPGAEWIIPTSFGGLAVFMLAWFMKRDTRREEQNEKSLSEWSKRMIGIENANNRMTRAILMLVMASNKHPGGAPVREQVEKLESEIDESERERARERGDELPDRR